MATPKIALLSTFCRSLRVSFSLFHLLTLSVFSQLPIRVKCYHYFVLWCYHYFCAFFLLQLLLYFFDLFCLFMSDPHKKWSNLNYVCACVNDICVLYKKIYGVFGGVDAENAKVRVCVYLCECIILFEWWTNGIQLMFSSAMSNVAQIVISFSGDLWVIYVLWWQNNNN